MERFHGSLSFGHAGLLISKTRGDVPVVFNVQGWIVKLIGVILMKFVQVDPRFEHPQLR